MQSFEQRSVVAGGVTLWGGGGGGTEGSAAVVHAAGWLMVRSPKRWWGWRKRWVALDGPVCRMHKDPKAVDTKAADTVPLSKCSSASSMASVAGSKPEYRHQLALTVGSKEYRLGTGDEAELQRWVEALRTVVRQFKLKLDITTMSSISLAEVDGLSHGGGESGIAAAGLVLRRRLSAVSLSAVGAVAGATDYVLNAIPTRKVGVAAASHIGSTDPSSEPVLTVRDFASFRAYHDALRPACLGATVLSASSISAS